MVNVALTILLLVKTFFIVENKNIPIVVFLDEGYLRPIVVVLTSLFENANPDTFYHVSVLVPGDFEIQARMKIESLEKKYKSNKIMFIDMGDKYRDMNKSRFPFTTYYRLDIANVLPHEKKCIVIEGDQIVRHDLSELFNISVEDYYIAGVCHSVSKQLIRGLRLRDGNNYTNVGVMLMNLEKIREDKLEEKFSRILKEKNSIIQKYLADQDVYNIACYGKILCLPYKFGYLINLRQHLQGHPENDIMEDPVIVHFAHVHKPWKYPEKTIFHKEFWNYASKTNLYDEEIERLKNGLDVISEKDGRIVTKNQTEELRPKKKKGKKVKVLKKKKERKDL